jgi:hypothetical protein
MMALHVAALWRYPVKSLAGEPLTMAAVGPDGIAGDRIVRVRGPEGVRTARRQYRLLGLRGTLDRDGNPRINDYPWDSAEALALVRGAAGRDAWLEAWEGADRFDILPLLVATDGAIAAFGVGNAVQVGNKTGAINSAVQAFVPGAANHGSALNLAVGLIVAATRQAVSNALRLLDIVAPDMM